MPEKDYFVYESSYVDDPCSIGPATKIWHFSHIMKNSRIGAGCNIGQNVVISPDAVIRKYYHQWIGINSRLDALQAAVLRVKLQYFDRWSAGRQRNADHYRARLAKLSVPVTCLSPAPYQTRHIYNQFVIRTSQRDALQECLKKQGIGTEVYYPLPLHLQPCYSELGYRRGDFPISEKLAAESLALPVHCELASEDIEHVCQAIRSFYADRCGSAQL